MFDKVFDTENLIADPMSDVLCGGQDTMEFLNVSFEEMAQLIEDGVIPAWRIEIGESAVYRLSKTAILQSMMKSRGGEAWVVPQAVLNMELHLTIDEVAQYLHMTTGEIWDIIADGQIAMIQTQQGHRVSMNSMRYAMGVQCLCN